MKMPGDVIREEIRKFGSISFARFMETALYCPESGYYEGKKDIVGRRGDFITSVSTGPLFGQLLAFQFAEWLAEWTAAHERVKIVEAGAHDGTLAADILEWLQTRRPELLEQIEYVMVEPSAARRRWQEERLTSFRPKIRWASCLADLTNPPSAEGGPDFSAIIFGNELLDAFPVHRYGWDAGAKTWFEWGVGMENGKFVWTPCGSRFSAGAPGESHGETDSTALPLSPWPSSILDLPPSLLEVLPDGYVVEACPAAEAWWHEAGTILPRGKLLAIDYGFTAAEQFSPSRTRGTLRAYHQHHLGDDLLADPGQQDLTAHVNFSTLQAAGEAAGLRTEQFCTQPQFLTQILKKAVAAKEIVQLDPAQVRQFQTLTHPEHLGRAFRVLVQAK
jgi:SAM-dependent MidA family methyltransferase